MTMMASTTSTTTTTTSSSLKMIFLVVTVLLAFHFRILIDLVHNDTTTNDESEIQELQQKIDETKNDNSIVNNIMNDFFKNRVQQQQQQQQQPQQQNQKMITFYILSIPETTTSLVQQNNNKTKMLATKYYERALNEESAEIWLHKGFERLPQRTFNPKEADVFVIVGYLHLYHGLQPKPPKRRSNNDDNKQRSSPPPTWTKFVSQYRNSIVDPTKPHLLLVPSWNPTVSRKVGIYGLINTLKAAGGIVHEKNLWSAGFERNPMWQGNLSPSRIIPIPYVYQSTNDGSSTTTQQRPQDPSRRAENFVFYAGDARANAQGWAGCHRSDLISSISSNSSSSNSSSSNSSLTDTTMDVRIVGKKNRLDESIYNMRMKTSEYCLILCGDTPTSRSLTSAIVSGCIPVRIGSRLRGLCEPPCHKGFGWALTGPRYTHLPYTERIPWEQFPEIGENDLLKGGKQQLDRMFQQYDTSKKKKLYDIMDEVRSGWIYGWGDPVTSNKLGDAALYIYESFITALKEEKVFSSE
jgi:hypothetical protein